MTSRITRGERVRNREQGEMTWLEMLSSRRSIPGTRPMRRRYDIDRMSVDVKSGAIIEKDPLGNVSTLDSKNLPTAWGLGGAAGGALIGALVGLLAGPGGAAIGTAAGAAAAGSGAAVGAVGGGLAGGTVRPGQLGAEGRLPRHRRDLFAAGEDGGGGGGRGRLDRADRPGGGAAWRHRLPRGDHGLTRAVAMTPPARRLAGDAVTVPRCALSAAPALRYGGTTPWIPARRINWPAPGSG